VVQEWDSFLGCLDKGDQDNFKECLDKCKEHQDKCKELQDKCQEHQDKCNHWHLLLDSLETGDLAGMMEISEPYLPLIQKA